MQHLKTILNSDHIVVFTRLKYIEINSSNNNTNYSQEFSIFCERKKAFLINVCPVSTHIIDIRNPKSCKVMIEGKEKYT